MNDYIRGPKCACAGSMNATALLSRARQRARKLGVAFDLTHEWFAAEFAKDCAFSGLAFDPSSKRGPGSPAINRKNRSGGYTKANCRLILNYFHLVLSECKCDIEDLLPAWRSIAERVDKRLVNPVGERLELLLPLLRLVLERIDRE